MSGKFTTYSNMSDFMDSPLYSRCLNISRRLCHKSRDVSPERAELLFAILDKDGNNEIDEGEFLHLGHVMLLEFERADAYKTYVERSFPSIYHSSWFQVSFNGSNKKQQRASFLAC